MGRKTGLHEVSQLFMQGRPENHVGLVGVRSDEELRACLVQRTNDRERKWQIRGWQGERLPGVSLNERGRNEAPGLNNLNS